MKNNDKQVDSAVIQRGEVAIQCVANLKEELNCALQRADQIMIRLTETSQVDDTRLELLCSAQRNAAMISCEISKVDQYLCKGGGQRNGGRCPR